MEKERVKKKCVMLSFKKMSSKKGYWSKVRIVKPKKPNQHKEK
jgi:hypothetical protein